MLTGVTMKAFLLALFLLSAPARAETQPGNEAGAGSSQDDTSVTRLFDLFMQVCVHGLHAPAQARDLLDRAGWSPQPLAGFNEDGLFANVMFHGLKDAEGAFYLSPDQGSGFVFGPSDNDLNPNSRCMLATTLSGARPFVEWATKAFDGHVHSDRTGKRFGNRLREWQVRDFPENISADLPIAAVTLVSGLSATGSAEAEIQISVTGLIPCSER